MSDLCSSGFDGDAPRRNAAAAKVADGLALIASPVFAAMAALIHMTDGGLMPCSAAYVSPLGGMATMYLLMSAFHAAPWIRMIRTRLADGTPSKPPA
jgi:hypothetical protein